MPQAMQISLYFHALLYSCHSLTLSISYGHAIVHTMFIVGEILTEVLSGNNVKS